MGKKKERMGHAGHLQSGHYMPGGIHRLPTILSISTLLIIFHKSESENNKNKSERKKVKRAFTERPLYAGRHSQAAHYSQHPHITIIQYIKQYNNVYNRRQYRQQ